MAAKKDKKKIRQKKIKKSQNIRKRNMAKKTHPLMGKEQMQYMTEAIEKSFVKIDEGMSNVKDIIERTVKTAKDSNPELVDNEEFSKQYEKTMDQIREYKAESAAKQLELAAFSGDASKLDKLSGFFDDLNKELEETTDSISNMFAHLQSEMSPEDREVVSEYISVHKEPTEEEMDNFLNEIPDIPEQEEAYDDTTDRS